MKERNEIFKKRNDLMEKMLTNGGGASNGQENSRVSLNISTPNAHDIEYLDSDFDD